MADDFFFGPIRDRPFPQAHAISDVTSDQSVSSRSQNNLTNRERKESRK
jgi:hypothetical protein